MPPAPSELATELTQLVEADPALLLEPTVYRLLKTLTHAYQSQAQTLHGHYGKPGTKAESKY